MTSKFWINFEVIILNKLVYCKNELPLGILSMRRGVTVSFHACAFHLFPGHVHLKCFTRFTSMRTNSSLTGICCSIKPSAKQGKQLYRIFNSSSVSSFPVQQNNGTVSNWLISTLFPGSLSLSLICLPCRWGESPGTRLSTREAKERVPGNEVGQIWRLRDWVFWDNRRAQLSKQKTTSRWKSQKFYLSGCMRSNVIIVWIFFCDLSELPSNKGNVKIILF